MNFHDSTEQGQEFMARNADECFTDEHLEQFFVADMEVQGFRPDPARCMAPGVVTLVREHGFADVFGERSVDMTGRLADLRAECDVD